MDSHSPAATNPLSASPAAAWTARVASACAALVFLPLFPLAYLAADLLASRGHVPSYHSLTGTQQAAFRSEWETVLSKQPDVTEALQASSSADWESKWRAATSAYLTAKVNPNAAATYAPADGSTTDQPLGLLATVVRNRDHWSGTVLGWFASWNSWTWIPGESTSANTSYLTGIFVLAFLVLLLRAGLVNGAAHFAAVATIAAGTRLRRAIYTHGFRVASVAVRADAQIEAGEVLTAKVEDVQDGLHSELTGFVRGLIGAGLIMLVLLAAHFWLTVFVLLLVLLVWLVAGQTAAYFRRDAKAAARRADARLAMIRESVTHVQLVKAYLMERFSQTRFERHLTDLTRTGWRRRRGDAFSRPVLLLAVSVAGLSVFYLAGRMVLAGDLSIAGLVVKAAAVAGLVYGLNRWLAARARVARGSSALAEVTEFLDRRADAGQPIDAEFLQPMAKKLELVGVSVREPGTGRMILDSVAMTIPAGSRSAVVFSDADEARALAYLITRFLDPTAGEVRVDGKNTRWVTYESIRSQVALVLEGSWTFSDTVANNIGCGDPSFTLPQIVEAAKIAHAHQFIQRLAYGYETQVGDGGSALRPGERFRLALARAILRDPSLLVVEEPATPLDPDSTVLIDDTIARIQTGRTLIFLARRPSTVKSADRVFVLQQGKLTASGSHDELVGGSEFYRLMHFKHGP